MNDERALIAEACSRDTSRTRLAQLVGSDSRAVRVAALSNPVFDIRELALLTHADDVQLSEDALDAVIARGGEFQYVMWDEPRAMELVPLRLTETKDGSYVVSDSAFEAFMRGWNSATAEVVAFGVADRKSILSLYLETDVQDPDRTH